MKQFCTKCQKEVNALFEITSNSNVCAECGHVLKAFDLPVGTIVGGFMIDGIIGRGGMGTVYRATQINLERHVALKVLNNELSKDLEFVDRFFKEARSAASLSHHNIVQAYDAGATPEGIYYFAMELIEGETVERRIDREGQLPYQSVVNIAFAIADALNYAWDRQKLCHGDIKPENIILNSSGEAKLADLGLAKSMHEEHHDKDIMATPLYAPPEVIRGEKDKIGFQADIYSFGATLFHMAAGVPPFPGSDSDKIMQRHLDEQPALLSTKCRDVDPGFAQIVDKMLQKDLEKRPASWEEVARDLQNLKDAFLTGSFNMNYLKKDQEPVKGGLNKWVIRLGLTAGVLLMMVVVYLLGARQNARNNDEEQVVKPAPVEEKIQPENTQNDVLTNWQKLKTSLPKFSDQAAYNKVKQFLQENQMHAPDEVNIVLKELQGQLDAKKAAETAKRNKQRSGFRQKARKLIGQITPNSKLSYLSPKELNNTKTQIQQILASNKKAGVLKHVLSKQEQSTLESSLIIVNQSIAKMQKKAQKAAKKQVAKKNPIPAKKAAAVSPKVKKVQKQPVPRVTRDDKLYQEYFNLLADHLDRSFKKRSFEQLTESLKGFKKKNSKLPRELNQKCDFMMRHLKDTTPIPQIFVTHKKHLLAKPLLTSVVSNKYKVADVLPTKMKLFSQEGKIKVGKYLKWSKFSAKNYQEILDSYFIDKDKLDKMTLDEQRGIIVFLIVNNQKLPTKNLDYFEKLKPGEKQLWTRLKDDFDICEKEHKAQVKWERIQKYIKEKNFSKVATYLESLSVFYKQTRFYKNHQATVHYMRQKYATISSAGDADKMLKSYKDLLKKGDVTLAFQAAMTAASRYQADSSVGIILRKDIVKNKQLAYEALKKESSVQSIKDNRVPFFYWEYDLPGEALVYYELVKKDPNVAADLSQVSKFFKMNAYLDAGGWNAAQDAYYSITDDDFSNLRHEKGYFRNWLPSFAFGYVYMTLRKENYRQMSNGLNALFRQYNYTRYRFAKLHEVIAPLAIYSSILTRSYENQATRVIREFNVDKITANPMNIRIPLLDLILTLQTAQPHDFMLTFERYKNRIDDKIPEIQGDVFWLRAVEKVMNKRFRINKQSLDELKEAKCKAPQLCAILMLDALAYAINRNMQPPGNIHLLLDVINEQYKNNLIGGQVWSRSLAIRLALVAGNRQKMLNVVEDALAKPQTGVTPYYPQLMLLQAAIRKMSGKYVAENLKNNYEKAMKTCAIASNSQRKAGSIITSPKPLMVIEDFNIESFPENTFWMVIAGLISNASNKNQKQELNTYMVDEFAHKMTLPEKLLLKKMNQKLR